jgi:hypothetical protein
MVAVIKGNREHEEVKGTSMVDRVKGFFGGGGGK